jgi:hypothetical protein
MIGQLRGFAVFKFESVGEVKLVHSETCSRQRCSGGVAGTRPLMAKRSQIACFRSFWLLLGGRGDVEFNHDKNVTECLVTKQLTTPPSNMETQLVNGRL